MRPEAPPRSSNRRILKENNFSPNAIQVPSQGANLKKLETNTSEIGYISSVLAMQSPQLKVFKFEGVEPTNENVINGNYKLTRPLLLIVKGTPDTASQKFIDFVLHNGQKIVVKHGYVPVQEGPMISVPFPRGFAGGSDLAIIGALLP